MAGRHVFGVAVAGLVAMLTPGVAHAYVDPGAGSLLLQVLVAGLLGALFAIRACLQRIKEFVKRIFGRRSGQ